jgi:hypothetical protein
LRRRAKAAGSLGGQAPYRQRTVPESHERRV